jgi:hypothetical protein
MLEQTIVGTDGQMKVFTGRTTLEFPDYEFITEVDVKANQPYMALISAPRFTPAVSLMKKEAKKERTEVTHEGTSGASYTLMGTHRGNNNYVLEIALGGPLGTATYHLSKDGGQSWGDTIIVPVDGLIDIGDGTTFVFGDEDDLVTDDKYSWQTTSLMEFTHRTDEVTIEVSVDVYTAQAKELLGEGSFVGYIEQIRRFFSEHRALHYDGYIFAMEMKEGYQPLSDTRAGKFRGFIGVAISGALYHKTQAPTFREFEVELVSPTAGSGRVLLGAKIYSDGEAATEEVARWIAERCMLIVTLGSVGSYIPVMKETNPNLIVLHYFRPALTTEEENPDSIIPIGTLKADHDDWFWKTEPPDSDYIHPADPPYQEQRYLMDPAVGPEGYAQHWMDEFKKMIPGAPYDGIMSDLTPIRISKMEQLYPGCSWKYTQEQFELVQEEFLASLKQVLNADGKVIVPNNVNTSSPTDPDYLVNTRMRNVDGLNQQWFMMMAKNEPEDPFISQVTTELFMNHVDAYSAAGKISILQVSPRQISQGFSEEQVRADILYCIGGYLLVQSGVEVYMVVDWNGSYAKLRDLFDTFGDLFETDYGFPVGDRWKEGGLWKRCTSKGRVEVDLVNHTFDFVPK